MSATILQINFDYDGSWDDYEAGNAAAAGQIAGIPGLGWKVWLKNVATGEAGGIYLFHRQGRRTRLRRAGRCHVGRHAAGQPR